MRSIVLIFFAIVMLVSCSPVRTIPIEIALIPEKKVSSEIQSLTLVNRAVNTRFSNVRADSLQQLFYLRQFKMDTILFDRTAADTLMTALGDMLFESGRFDVVIPENRFLNANTYSYLPSLMPWHEVDTLTSQFNTDAVLSLDYFRTNVITNYSKETLFDRDANRFFTGYYAVMDIAYEALFRLYDPVKRSVEINLTITDTLHWEDYDTEIRPLFNRFTTVKQGMIESGIHASLKLSSKIAPEWRTTRRQYYFKGHPLLDQAHQRILEGDWPGAAETWHTLADMPVSRSVKSKAEFNLALAYEMFGNFEEALKWGIKSYETLYHPLTYTYLERLNARKQQISGQ
jgi:hypothetical protein